ncbi:unnamed protein product [Diabrotica balteata]|uniref:Uncharacterized protein n=1 Tax=Diabrotica balteata TaxID=107213 RepID=A0A9N9SSL5_DIABA|nr:unnamed protein product [Diabrotica balteata]
MDELEYSVFDYLERLSSEDYDIRMLAVVDISVDVGRGLLIFDDEYQIQAIYRVLALLEDPNNQIKNAAVKCLAAFARKFLRSEVESILTILATNVVSNFHQLRKISIYALKMIFSELPQAFSLSEHVCEIISDVLYTAAENKPNFSKVAKPTIGGAQHCNTSGRQQEQLLMEQNAPNSEDLDSSEGLRKSAVKDKELLGEPTVNFPQASRLQKALAKDPHRHINEGIWNQNFQPLDPDEKTLPRF